VEQRRDGTWLARHASPHVGVCAVSAASRQEVVDKLRGELRYRLEICPCTGELYRDLEIEIATN
jgi:hypothetical protein